jgi:dienelactone hydrolase
MTKNMAKARRSRRRWLWSIPVMLVLVLAGAFLWANDAAAPLAEATAALQSDDQVTVTSGNWLVFSPAGREATTGFIFYPGGRVDPRAYAPSLRSLAAQGYLVVDVPMPFNLAVLATDKAAEVSAAYPGVRRWIIGGHSLGGSMAARYAHSHPGAVAGLVLWAAYPDTSDDLSRTALPVVSIYGSQDGLATTAKIAAAQALLPQGTRYVGIVGGNHAQFGSYGPQSGDNPAGLSREMQQARVVAATAELLQQIARGSE